MNINIDQIGIPQRTRHFGFRWTPQADIYTVFGTQFGEFYWISYEDTGYDSEWHVYHDDETGEFLLIEAGGRGPDVWDQEHGHWPSPLAAMQEARRITNARLAQWRLEERE